MVRAIATKSSEGGKVLWISPTSRRESSVSTFSSRPVIGCRLPLRKGCDFGTSSSSNCMLFPEEDGNWGILAIRGTSSPYWTGIWTVHHNTHYWSSFFFLNHEASINPFKQPHKGDVPQLRRKGKLARLERVNILNSSLQYSLAWHIGTLSLAEFCFISVLHLKAELLKQLILFIKTRPWARYHARGFHIALQQICGSDTDIRCIDEESSLREGTYIAVGHPANTNRWLTRV